MNLRLVGFAGPIGSGKTTAAQELCLFGWKRIRFADTLKNMLAVIGLNISELDGPDKEKPTELLGGKTPRYGMQTLGTEWGRNLIHPDLWVMTWKRKVERALVAKSIVVDDVRFPNEVRAIQSLGGIVISIRRPGIEQQKHASEEFAFVANDVYDNNVTEEEFRRLIRVNLVKQ